MKDIIVDVDMLGQPLQVIKKENGLYDVIHGNVPRHPDCTTESVMRALGQYIHSLNYHLEKEKTKCQ